MRRFWRRITGIFRTLLILTAELDPLRDEEEYARRLKKPEIRWSSHIEGAFQDALGIYPWIAGEFSRSTSFCSFMCGKCFTYMNAFLQKEA